MDNIVFVCPQKFLSSENDWQSACDRTGYIPILKADLQKFQEALGKIAHKREINSKLNNENLLHETRRITSGNGNTIKDETTKNELNSDTSNNIGTLNNVKYQPIKQFLPISLKQQLHTIALGGIKADIKNEAIERFLVEIIKLSCSNFVKMIKDVAVDSIFEAWSTISTPGVENQDVFVRFEVGSKAYPYIVKYLEQLLKDSLRVNIDNNAKQFIEESIKEKTISPLTITDDEYKKFKSLLNGLSLDIKDKTQDSYNEISTQYQIDLATLNDISRDDLDQLCKDIIEFRTKVVTIEKEKKRQETYNESERQRQQMMKVFDRIKQNHPDEKEQQLTGTNFEIDDDIDYDEEDISTENQIEDRRKEESEKRYKELLKILNTDIEPRLHRIHSNIQKENNYEKELLKKRSLNLKDILNLGNDTFYDNHRSFKEDEHMRDTKDRNENGDTIDMESHMISEEEKDNDKDFPESEIGQENGGHINIKFAFKKAIDKSLEETNEISNQPERAELSSDKENDKGLIDILPFSNEELSKRLSELRGSKYVDELVKEYLGVYEDELVEYIFENITENKNRQILLADLKETFDEDAVTMVNSIWKRKEFVE